MDSGKHFQAVLNNLPVNVTVIDVREIVRSVLHDARICRIEIYHGRDSMHASRISVLNLHPDTLPVSLFLNLHGRELNGCKIEAYLRMSSMSTAFGELVVQNVSHLRFLKRFRPYRSREGIQHSRKVFVGGLPASVDSVTLGDHFMRYGRVKKCGVVRDIKGVSRKFGFCEFWCVRAFHAAVSVTEHIIAGRVVGVRPYCIRPDTELT